MGDWLGKWMIGRASDLPWCLSDQGVVWWTDNSNDWLIRQTIIKPKKIHSFTNFPTNHRL